ncbi:MAG TPA: LptA/OstA family protein [Spirochaetales bacterium]|nr:LptA/OstA family protein [Spirochaetales bacterium]HPM71497.1 LptA/OstA family protein [Spirochaetales bacterium]
MSRRRFFVAALALALAAASVAADDFSFSADSMSGAMAKGRERAVLVGNAVVVSGGMRITADRIELYGDDFRFAECSGRVSVVDDDKGLRLTTEHLFYDRRDKLSRLTGPSVMEDSQNKVVIKGDYIENDDRRKIAIVQVNVRILKESLSCRADFARYDRSAKSLELSGWPTVRRDGDLYSAETILVDLDTEDIVLVGSVSGSVAAGKKEPGKKDDAPAVPEALPTEGADARPDGEGEGVVPEAPPAAPEEAP